MTVNLLGVDIDARHRRTTTRRIFVLHRAQARRLHGAVDGHLLRCRGGSGVCATALDAIAVHTSGGARVEDAHASLVAALEVDVFDVEGVDVTGQHAEEGEQEVDAQVGAAAGNEEYAEGWDWRDGGQ